MSGNALPVLREIFALEGVHREDCIDWGKRAGFVSGGGHQFYLISSDDLETFMEKDSVGPSGSFGEEIHDRLVSFPYALEEKVGRKY